GTDFKGGTEVEIAFTKPVNAADVRTAVNNSGFADPEVVSVADSSNPHHFLIRVQEVTVLTSQEQDMLRARMCQYEPPNPRPAVGVPEASASEIKFSPGGDKIFARYETAPDLAAIKKQLTGVEGVELRAGEKNPLLANERDHRVEIQLKSRGD